VIIVGRVVALFSGLFFGLDSANLFPHNSSADDFRMPDLV
jgi:hypothetical protein